MHPAFSLVFFTTATGAGYGLLALVGIFSVLGLASPLTGFCVASLGLAFALIISGLLSSTGHLGRPERAWRAFSQWRTSWLSREGLASVITFIPAGAFAIGWIYLGPGNIWVSIAGILAAVSAMITVYTTGMIYASLKPIAQWHSRFTAPGYIAFSLMTGSVLLNAMLHVFGAESLPPTIVALATTLWGWAWKWRTWSHNDTLGSAISLNSATGLKEGTVRSIEWPHTEENYLLKEMGFRIARKHQARLRLITQLLAFLVPVLLICGSVLLWQPLGIVFSILAALSQFCGILVERWLFFAEAKHNVAVYYGR
ncbi:MAG: dimethyl sulfoxide reductase anchor subunit [Rhizobiaceae bacterium]|nr:dimethyl sulfoxide reductase anchor subunit [Rhizobiaceae bacterium]